MVVRILDNSTVNPFFFPAEKNQDLKKDLKSCLGILNGMSKCYDLLKSYKINNKIIFTTCSII